MRSSDLTNLQESLVESMVMQIGELQKGKSNDTLYVRHLRTTQRMVSCSGTLSRAYIWCDLQSMETSVLAIII